MKTQGRDGTSRPGVAKLFDGLPQFSMPMIQMQSVLVPSYCNPQSEVIAPIPISFPSDRPRDTSSSASSKFTKSTAATCQLPFKDQDIAKETIHAPTIGRRVSGKQSSGYSTSKSFTSKFDEERSEAARAKLNKNLHAEHREFMEGLKLEREIKFRRETAAAIILQRYFRGLMVRVRLNPKKYSALRNSLATVYSMEEISRLVEEAIVRSGVELNDI